MFWLSVSMEWLQHQATLFWGQTKTGRLTAPAAISAAGGALIKCLQHVAYCTDESQGKPCASANPERADRPLRHHGRSGVVTG